MAGVLQQRTLELSGRYLTLHERRRSADLAPQSQGMHGTAAVVGRAPSTISRALRRNQETYDGIHEATLSHLLAEERAKRLKVGKIEARPRLREFSGDKLSKVWTAVANDITPNKAFDLRYKRSPRQTRVKCPYEEA